MDAYLFNASLYCPDCIVDALISAKALSPAAREMGLEAAREQWIDANGFGSESDFDSEEMAKGPFPDGGGESDSPAHCDSCHAFLENPLTSDGMAYVHSAILEKLSSGRGECVKEWSDFYDVSLSDLFEHASETLQSRLREHDRVTLDSGKDAVRRDYWSDVRGIADDFKRAAKDADFTDAEGADEWLHQTVDGHSRVIYTGGAMLGLWATDNQDAYAEDFGSEGMVSDGTINWSALMFCALRADVLTQLDAEGIDPSDPETWKPVASE